jgi:PPOX class probable F420-dependent enzyme
MRRGLTADDLGDFLLQPITATLATYQADGTVRLSAVWFEWSDGGFSIVIGRDGVMARHLGHDPRASLAVHESAPPWRGIEMRTIAEFTDGPAAETDRRMAVRYLGRDRAEAFASAEPEAQILVRLEPGELRAWDFADDPLV